MTGDALDQGTLFAARFNDDGSGEWLALDIDDAGFLAAAAMAGVEFKDQADVLVNTRLAADVVGATRMDRPEWGAAHPQTRGDHRRHPRGRRGRGALATRLQG